MSSKAMNLTAGFSVQEAKRTFESSIAKMQQGANLPARQQPIHKRQTVESTEKRAIADAARALAQLWNISLVR